MLERQKPLTDKFMAFMASTDPDKITIEAGLLSYSYSDFRVVFEQDSNRLVVERQTRNLSIPPGRHSYVSHDISWNNKRIPRTIVCTSTVCNAAIEAMRRKERKHEDELAAEILAQ